MAALGYRSCRKPQVQPFIHVDAFFLTFDIDAPSDPIPLSCDDHGAVLTATTTHGLASLPSSLRLRLVQDARLSVWLQRDRRLQDSYQGWCTPVDQLDLCRPIKKTFVSQLAEVERREALSILGAQRSRRARKRARRGFGFCAPQSCTSGFDRRSDRSAKLRPETSVARKDQPKAEPMN